MSNFYSIYISVKDSITTEQVKNEMDKALDWFRLDKNCWIVYSTSEIDKWMARLKKLVEPEGSLFICKMDITDRNGWMTKEFWEWLKKDRS